MRQLSGMDVNFLNMETPSTFGHVASLNIYDPAGAPGGAGLEATKRIILERIDQLAPFRRRLVEVPTHELKRASLASLVVHEATAFVDQVETPVAAQA